MTRRPRDETERRLDELFDKLFHMSDAELRLVRLGWEEADAAERAAIWDRMRPVVGRGDGAEMMEATRSTLSKWVNSYLSATAIEYGNFLINPGSGMNPTEVRRGAIPPMLDAAAAVIAAGVLDPDDQELLLEPINSVAGHRRSA